jgi:dihydroorotase-like cyclic amidohydrolase
MADDFESGTRAAAFGGNTTVLPFCLQERGQSLRQAVRDYHAKADGNCYIDVSFHLIISDPTEQVLAIEETASEPALAGRMLPELAKRLMPTQRDTLFTTPDKHQDVAD